MCGLHPEPLKRKHQAKFPQAKRAGDTLGCEESTLAEGHTERIERNREKCGFRFRIWDGKTTNNSFTADADEEERGKEIRRRTVGALKLALKQES